MTGDVPASDLGIAALPEELADFIGEEAAAGGELREGETAAGVDLDEQRPRLGDRDVR